MRASAGTWMWLLLLIASVALALVQWGPTPVDSYPIWRREDSRRGPSCPASYDKGELYKHPAWSFGVNMKLVEVANAGECCAKCNADPACVVWLFQDKNLDEFESADDSTIKEILDNAAFTSVPGDDGNGGLVTLDETVIYIEPTDQPIAKRRRGDDNLLYCAHVNDKSERQHLSEPKSNAISGIVFAHFEATPDPSEQPATATPDPVEQPETSTLDPVEQPETSTLDQPATATPDPVEQTATATPAPTDSVESSTTDLESSTVDPESSAADPEDSTPSVTLELEPSSAALDPPSATPEPSSATPEPSSATPEPSSATPEPSSATPEPSSATPDPPSATPTPTYLPPAFFVEPATLSTELHALDLHAVVQNVDAFGSILGFTWKLQSGPVLVQLIEAATLPLTRLVAGVYEFEVTMLYRIGEEELSISNQSSIEIRPRQNAGPKIGNAIKDFDIEGLPDQLATVDIQVPEVMDDEDAMDPNSYPLRFNWAITSGVGGVIEDPHSFKHVEVTNLRLGTYTVKLEVTDTDGHMTPTVFTIVYREPSLPIPVAHAGQNITVVLPNNTATLDPSQSTAAAGFKSIVWEADSTNPVVVTLTTLDDTQTRVEGLTVPGVYTFKLTVTDVRDYTSVDRVSIIVIEDFPPTAVAPAEYHISTTSALLELDGSQSTDDRTATANLGFLWEKQLESPAAGTLVDASLPVAKLVDFISGTYVFKLTVTDSAGQTATTLTSVYVENDDKSLYLLEIRLDANIEQFTESNAESVRGKLALALGTTSEYVVIDTIRSGSVIMTFHVVNTTTGLPIFAGSIVSTLRDLLHSSKLQVGFPILSVDPYLCDNTCSGHGTCDTLTKECVCDPYWVENVFATKFQGAASNCGWSVVYVILVCGIIFLVLLALGWAIFWACSKRCCKKGARKTMLDRRSRGGAGRFDSLELMPRSSQPGGLMNDSDGDGSDDDDEEEDIFDERYLVGGTPKPPPSSKVARMIRQSSQANVTPGTPSQNAARAASTSMILSHSDDEDQPFEGINGNAHAVAKAQQKPQQQQQPAGGASSFATPVRGLMSRLTGKTPNGKDANGHGNGTHANSSNSNNNNNNNSNNVSSPTRKPRGPTSRSGGYSRVSTNNGDKHSLLAKSDSWEDLNIE